MFKIIRRVIIICAVLLAVLVVDLLQYGNGVVPTIAVAQKSDDALELQMTYILPMGGYSVYNVAADEVEHTSNGSVDYDGSLGQYRIMIQFGDTEPHLLFVKGLFKNEIYELNKGDVTLKMKISHPDDHGFVLYIGSDSPIHTEQMEGAKLDGILGMIKIPIEIG